MHVCLSSQISFILIQRRGVRTTNTQSEHVCNTRPEIGPLEGNPGGGKAAYLLVFRCAAGGGPSPPGAPRLPV